MSSVIYKDDKHLQYPELKAWVETIMTSIIPLCLDTPKASARVIDRQDFLEFELQVEWCDALMEELLVETFTHQVAKLQCHLTVHQA